MNQWTTEISLASNAPCHAMPIIWRTLLSCYRWVAHELRVNRVTELTARILLGDGSASHLKKICHCWWIISALGMKNKTNRTYMCIFAWTKHDTNIIMFGLSNQTHRQAQKASLVNKTTVMTWHGFVMVCLNMMHTPHFGKFSKKHCDQSLANWWFQPHWKILVRMDHHPNYWGKYKSCSIRFRGAIFSDPHFCALSQSQILNLGRLSSQKSTWRHGVGDPLFSVPLAEPIQLPSNYHDLTSAALDFWILES